MALVVGRQEAVSWRAESGKGRDACRSTRLTVEAEKTPTLSARREYSMRWRRGSTMSSALAGSTARGECAAWTTHQPTQLHRRQVVAQPLSRGRRGHAMRNISFRCAEAASGHLFDHLDTASEGKSGMLMGVHLMLALEWIGCLANSSLSNPIRTNTGYNPFRYYS